MDDPMALSAEDTSSIEASEARYDFELDLESDSTHARVVRLIGSDRKVLELGPATGYMSAALKQRGCSVVGIEIDPEMAKTAAPHLDRVIVGDLDWLDLDAELGEERFDVIVAADVLEHLRDPLAALRTLRGYLAPEGFFVISLPNIAHGSVRLALLEGRFDYQKIGLLDETHLRFFTLQTIEQLMDDAELGIAELFRQQLNVEASEVPFDRDSVPSDVMTALERDPEARTYQFVLKAIPFATPGLRELQRRMRDQTLTVTDLRQEAAELRREADRLRETIAQMQQQTGEQRAREQELQTSLAAIAGREGQLRASLINAHEQLLQRDAVIDQLRIELAPLRQMIDQLKGTFLWRALQQVRRARRVAGFLKGKLLRIRAALDKV